MKTNRLMSVVCSALMVGTAFVALPSVTQAAEDHTDLILNPDFEEGKTVGWDISTSGRTRTSSSQPVRSSRMYRMARTR